jgi:hypothetical protein
MIVRVFAVKHNQASTSSTWTSLAASILSDSDRLPDMLAIGTLTLFDIPKSLQFEIPAAQNL